MASESDDYESREEGSSEAGCRENDAGESDSDDDFDDTAYGTMARFVPTLVLERLRAEGEAAVSNTPTSTPVPTASLPATNPTEGLNNPQVCPMITSLSRRCHILRGAEQPQMHGIFQNDNLSWYFTYNGVLLINFYTRVGVWSGMVSP